jgi:hypothetical protein
MECLNIDFVGPYPDGGYVFVAICTFGWSYGGRTKQRLWRAAGHLLQHFEVLVPTQLRSEGSTCILL